MMSLHRNRTLTVLDLQPVMTEPTSGGDDLEDGEIFDEEEETPAPIPNPPPPPVIGALTGGEKKQPVPRPKALQQRQRKQKRPREDDRPFKNNKQRRRSEEAGEKPLKDKNLTEDEEMREMSPLRGDWERVHQRSSGFDDLLDDDDEDLEGGGRRGGGRGFNRRRGGRNGRGGKRMNRREGGQICKFYLQGKCQKGNECPYSHASYQRKYELCKFYMMECCAKKERCPFLHSEFPCKYYHLGMKCFAGKKCKLSHGKISQQFRANLLRCEFLLGLDITPPGKEDLEVRRERRERRHRDHTSSRGSSGGGGDVSNNKERRRTKERKSSKEEDRYTLHFKVDPRTISDEEDGQKTPMPSPSQDNSSDRETHSPPPIVKTEILSPKSEVHLPDPKVTDNGIGEEFRDFIPADLPKHQRELYKRIQQQQREATSLHDGDELEGGEMGEKEMGDDYKDEYWYSSEEEESPKKMTPITMLLNKLKQQPARNPSPPMPQPPPPPIIAPSLLLPDIDINAVSKLLSTVRETIQQKQNIEKSKAAAAAAAAAALSSIPVLNLNPLPPLNALVADSQPPPEKRRRDPRLRGSSDDDVDLRRQDVDLRQLPFKPAPIPPPANEIDASITAHPPVAFHLIPISPPPAPDYSNLQPKNMNDPRLKRYLTGGVMSSVSGVPLLVPTGISSIVSAPLLIASVTTPPLARSPLATRDPRQARILPNDPRRKRDGDFRHTFNHVNDVDLRLQPPNLAFK